MSKLGNAIDKLQDTAIILNKVSDEINKIILELEGRLQKMNLGIECHHSALPLGILSYMKSEHGWGLHLADENGKYCKLIDAPRNKRISAMYHLASLFYLIDNESNILIKDIDTALAQINFVGEVINSNE